MPVGYMPWRCWPPCSGEERLYGFRNTHDERDEASPHEVVERVEHLLLSEGGRLRLSQQRDLIDEDGRLEQSPIPT